MKEAAEYQGVRLELRATLDAARIPVRIDVGFGDVITPALVEIAYPTLLGFPPPLLRAYPVETVIAEKFQMLVALGLANSRMKDFYDLWLLARSFEFNGQGLCDAIQATFRRRRTQVPGEPPVVLTALLAGDAAKSS